MKVTKIITVNISEDASIVDLSKTTQKYHSEVFLNKVVNGTPHEINLKSFLGLITLQLRNGDQITVTAEGEDAEEAINEVISFFS